MTVSSDKREKGEYFSLIDHFGEGKSIKWCKDVSKLASFLMQPKSKKRNKLYKPFFHTKTARQHGLQLNREKSSEKEEEEEEKAL